MEDIKGMFHYVGENSGCVSSCTTGTTATFVNRSISIETLNYGWVIRVGCQSFAIENPEKLTKYLLMYLKNPLEVSEKWMAKEFKLD